MAKAAAVAGAALTAAAGTAATVLLAMTKSTANAGDQLAKTSEKIGISVEDLSGLKHASDLSGLSFEGLETGLGRLARTMADAQEGTASAKGAFRDVGVAVEKADGTLRPVRDVLLDVADRFAGMTDETKKAALAQELFGRAGLQLIPFLNQGRAGIEALMAEAKRLGIVMTKDQAKAAEAFNDNWSRIGKALEGVKFQVGNALIPTLNNLLQIVVSFVQTEGFREWLTSIADRIRGSIVPSLMILAKAFLTLHDGLRILTNSAKGFWAIWMQLAIAREKWVAATSPWADIRKKAAEDAEQMEKALTKEMMASTAADAAARDLWASLGTLQQRLEAVGQTDVALKLGGTGGEAKKEIDDLFISLDGVRRLISDMGKEQAPFADAFRHTFGDVADEFTEDVKRMAAEQRAFADSFAHDFGKLPEPLQDLTITMDGVTRRIADMAAEQAKFGDAFEHTFGEIKIKTTDFAAFWRESMQGMGTAAQTAATWIAFTLGQMANATKDQMTFLANTVGQALSTVFADNKGFAIAMALINTAAGIARALADWAWPFSLVVAGIVAAAGAAQIGAIASTKLAMGGIVTEETLALIGERGPEAVIPLDQMARVMGEREIIVYNTIELDGRTVAKSMTRHMPRQLRFQAGVTA